MSQTLGEFLKALDRCTERVPLDELTAQLENLAINLDHVREFIRFHDSHYRRNLMHTGSGYQALILCWRNGQRSPIHDHRGSSCGVRVLKGVAIETIFARGPNGMIYPTRSRELPENSVCGSQDDDIHQISNLQAGEADLITLHVYSPPLLQMGTYSLTDYEVRQVEDPVFARSCAGGD